MQVLRCNNVTAGEFITGIIVNKWLAVWKLGHASYSDQPVSAVRSNLCFRLQLFSPGCSALGIFERLSAVLDL